MDYTRDPTPSLILSPIGAFLGSVWASGLFRGFMRFQEDKRIDLIINCLTEGRGELLALETEDGRMERTQRSLQMCARCLWKGGRVLVHCRHGIHRTGSFTTLLLAMLLMMSSRSMTLSLTSPRPSWAEMFERAWEFWAAKRGLEGRVNNRHDFYQESWAAFNEYYGEAPLDIIERMYTAMAEAFIEACGQQEVQQVLQTIRRVFIPLELTPAHDVRDVGDVGDGETRARSRSPPARQQTKLEAKARPKPKAKHQPPPPPPPQPPPPPLPPANDDNEVPDAQHAHWKAENVVEGEESQMPWRPFLKGDWRCSRCGNHNMHWRGYCFGQHGGCRNPRDANFRPGDWYCQCGNYNLHWRTHCNRGKCGRSRAGGGEQKPPGL